MSAPSEEDPHRFRWWLFVGGGALVGYLFGNVVAGGFWGLGLMLAYSLAEAIAERPGRDRGRAGEHTGDVSEPA